MNLNKEGYYNIIGLHSPMNLSQRKDVCQNKILLMSLNHFQLLWLQEMGLFPPLKTSEEIVHDERCNHEHVCPRCWSRCPGFHCVFNGLPGCSHGLLSPLSSWQRHLTFQKWSSNFRRKKLSPVKGGVWDARSVSTDSIMMAAIAVRPATRRLRL